MRSLDALIFDVDGTLADTEELHRQAFNEAFFACGVSWRWGPALYAELLLITGGKERMAGYLSQQTVSAAERRHLLGLIPTMHAAKTRLYRELVALGHLRPRAGVRRRDETRHERVRRVDHRHALEVDMGTRELWADVVDVIMHATKNGVGHGFRGIAARGLVPV